MKKAFRRLTAMLLAASLLLGNVLAANGSGSDATIDINTKFDFIMQLVDWYSLGAEEKDVLRDYFNQYFEKHPEEFTAVVNEIMQSIDPYSYYMTSKEYADSFGQTLGTFVGIGVTMFNGTPCFEDVYESGPAYEAGVRAGDVLTAVDGKSIAGMTNTEITKLLRGDANTSVVLTVTRAGKTLTFTVTRREVMPEHVSSKTLSKGVEYIRVGAFGNDADSAKFIKIWNGLAAKGTRAAIIDLRDNGGGLISMAQRMIEAIVPDKGRYYLGLRERADEGGLKQYYTPGGGPRLNKLILLVNGRSASASEIVAGALSDLGEAMLLGETTYGKGVGQNHMQLPDGSILVLTSLEMQLPKRGAYNGAGLKPDIQLKNSGKTTSLADELPALAVKTALLPGQHSDAVHAMTARLSLLGYLDSAQNGFDVAVLDAVRRFQLSNGLLPGLCATPDTLALLDARAKQQTANAQGLDDQLAAALAICKTAAAKPAQYRVNADGTWTNLS